jgi:hypothetical protein
MRTGFRLDQLRVDADAVAAFPHRALEDIADAEFGADLFHIDCSVLVREGRVHEDKPRSKSVRT